MSSINYQGNVYGKPIVLAPVTSVNSKDGEVVLNAEDVGAVKLPSRVPDGTDLNDLIQPGIYYVGSASNVTHPPTSETDGYAFALEVIQSAAVWRRQIAYSYKTLKVWERIGNISEEDNYVWSDWTQLKNPNELSITGDVTGTAGFDQNGNVQIQTSRRGCYTSDGHATNFWHKFASAQLPSNYDESSITFLVSGMFGSTFVHSGILRLHIRHNAGNPVVIFVWDLCPDGFVPADYVLCWKKDGTLNIELWAKDTTVNHKIAFEVLSESVYQMTKTGVFTLHTRATSVSNLPSGYTQVASECGGVHNKNETVDEFLTLNAYPGYGSGSAKIFYDGNASNKWLAFASNSNVRKVCIGTSADSEGSFFVVQRANGTRKIAFGIGDSNSMGIFNYANSKWVLKIGPDDTGTRIHMPYRYLHYGDSTDANEHYIGLKNKNADIRMYIASNGARGIYDVGIGNYMIGLGAEKDIFINAGSDKFIQFNRPIKMALTTDTWLAGAKEGALINSMAAGHTFIVLWRKKTSNGYMCIYAFNNEIGVYYINDSTVEANTNNVNEKTILMNGNGDMSIAHNLTVPYVASLGDLELFNGFDSTENVDDSVIILNSNKYIRKTGVTINPSTKVIKATAFTVTSSKRYKENVEAMSIDEASKILEVEPVEFDYVDGKKDCRGVIAEQVYEYIPSAVELDKDGQPDSVDYSKFVPYLIKMIKTQQEQIDRQQVLIEDLTGRIEALESR